MASIADIPFNPADNGAAAELAQTALYGNQEQGLGWRMLENVPNATSVAGWNAWRASNTIVGNKGGVERGRIRNHLPGNLSKMSSYHNITGTGKYSPFDILAKGGNWAERAISSKKLTPGPAGAGDEAAFASGTYSRISTASRLSMSASDSKAMVGAANFLNTTDPDFYKRIHDFHDLGNGGSMSGRQMGDYVSMSSKGSYSNAISGYMRGAQHGNVTGASRTLGNRHWVEGVTRNVTDDAGKVISTKTFGGAVKGAQHFMLGGGNKAFSRAGFKAASSAGVKYGAGKFALGSAAKAAAWATPGVNVAMAAWTAIDLTKMGIEAAREIPGFTRDALNSFKGGIQKPVFGTRYVDNDVAATSRQRGVTAIQNSQLNMRSALGSEAAGMHAYYG
jgi:hypothetical protein